MKKLIFIFILLILASCGRSSLEEKNYAILKARIALTNGKCQEAIDILEAIGRDQFNVDYLLTLSSAFSCRAGF